MMPTELVTLLQHVINGLSISSVYVIVALGITLVFGLTRLVNFAHGQFLVLGGFLAYSLTNNAVPFWLATALSSLGTGIFGLLLYFLVFRQSRRVPLNGFIISLGLLTALQSAYVEIWSSEQFQVQSSLLDVFDVAGIRITAERLVLIVTATILVAGFFSLLNGTDLGRSMRAVAENDEAAALVGVNVSSTVAASFFLGSLLAGAAGALLFAIFPFDAYSGGPFVIKGLAVALIGGLGSVQGAVVVGLALGMVETLGTSYGMNLGFARIGAEWTNGYAFLLMVAILTWRPQGLFRGARSATGA